MGHFVTLALFRSPHFAFVQPSPRKKVGVPSKFLKVMQAGGYDVGQELGPIVLCFGEFLYIILSPVLVIRQG